MHLVYPIYLDIPMMTGFLASLEGGIVEEAEMENRTADAKQKAAAASLKAGVSGLLSGLVSGEAGAEASGKVAETLESSYKSVVRYPSSALFIRLRKLLLEHEILVQVTSSDALASLNLGDIVEFVGNAKPHPAYQIQHAVGQLMPIVAASMQMNIAQIDQEVAKLNTIKLGSSTTVLGEEMVVRNKKHLGDLVALLESQKATHLTEVDVYNTINDMVRDFFRQDGADMLIFEMDDWQAICRIYPSFVRNEDVNEIHDATWTSLGKIIGFIPDGEEYDLLKGSPVGYLAKDQFAELAGSLRNEHLNVEVGNPVIVGPALIIAAMSIFA